MPELNTYTVPARSARKGDNIVIGHEEWTITDEPDRKRTRVHVVVSLLGGNVDRRVDFALDEEITVSREELTESEAKAAQRDHALRWVARHLDEFAPTSLVPERMRAIADMFESNPVGDPITSSSLANLLQLQARHNLWRGVAATLAKLRERYGDRVDALHALAAVLDGKSGRDYPQDPTSRSSAPLANLYDDLARWSLDELVNDLQFRIADEQLTESLAEVRAWNAEQASRQPALTP